MSLDLLEAGEQQRLLEIAHAGLAEELGDAPAQFLLPEQLTPRLKSARGLFVTLHAHEKLRGCIGQIEPELPLYLAAKELAIASATRDPRFLPVSADELPDIVIEISVLTPRRAIERADEVEVGVHGLVVSRGIRRGLLLPQVATEHHFDREAFLAATCEKAGLPPDAWRDPMTRVEIFSAQVFGDR